MNNGFGFSHSALATSAILMLLLSGNPVLSAPDMDSMPANSFFDFTDSVTTTPALSIDSAGLHQQTEIQRAYYNQTMQPRDFNRETWKKATEGLDYSDDQTKKSEVQKNDKEEQPAYKVSQQTLRLIAFAVLFCLLLLILLRAFGVQLFVGKKRQQAEQTFSTETIMENAPATAWDRRLQDAIEQSNYRLAVRIYYLMIIKELSAQQLIHWQKEKTNFDYVSELRNTSSYSGFREATLLFEQVWYGELNVSKPRFDELSILFKKLLTTLTVSS